MKYIFYEKESETRARVNLTYYVSPPQEMLDQKNWIQVDKLLEPESIEGKWAKTYCNPQTQEIWYEYEDIPKTPEMEVTNRAMNAQMMLMLVDAAVV